MTLFNKLQLAALRHGWLQPVVGVSGAAGGHELIIVRRPRPSSDVLFISPDADMNRGPHGREPSWKVESLVAHDRGPARPLLRRYCVEAMVLKILEDPRVHTNPKWRNGIGLPWTDSLLPPANKSQEKPI